MVIEHAIIDKAGRLGPMTRDEYDYWINRTLPQGWSILSIPDSWRKQKPADNPDIKPKQGLDSQFKGLSVAEWDYFTLAVNQVLQEAHNNAYKRPKMTTLLEEFSELVLAFRGKHDDSPELEVRQVASVAINLLWQMLMDEEVNNIVTNREPK